MTAQPTSFNNGNHTRWPVLAWTTRKPVARPVEIGKLQPFDVDAAQPEPGDQQNDRVVALPARVAPVDRLQDPGHVGGVPHRRDPGLLAGLHRRHRVHHGDADQSDVGREPEEGPHGAQLLLDGLELVTGQRGDERLDRPSIAARPARRGCPTNAAKSPATDPYVRTVDSERPAARSHALEPGDGLRPRPRSAC